MSQISSNTEYLIPSDNIMVLVRQFTSYLIPLAGFNMIY